MDLEIFLKQNKIKKENIKFEASESFKNNGKAVLWEIKAISAEERSEEHTSELQSRQ